jgi:hypothetical protein
MGFITCEFQNQTFFSNWECDQICHREENGEYSYVQAFFICESLRAHHGFAFHYKIKNW